MFTPLIIAAIVIVGVFVWSSVVLVKARRAGEASSGGYNSSVRSDLPSHLYQDAYRTSCPMLVLSSVRASLTHSQAARQSCHMLTQRVLSCFTSPCRRLVIPVLA